MYQVGETIIYGGEGACRVEAVGRLNMSGISKDKDYYTLAPLYREGKIYAPVDTPVFTRPIITGDEAESLIRAMPSIEAASCGERSTRLLNEHYQTLLRSHSCTHMVQLIKEVYEKQQEKKTHGIRPGQVDERYMKRAEDLLHGELAAALGIPREDVAAYIRKTIEEMD